MVLTPLIGNQTVVHLINFVGYRTVLLLNPSFKNFIYPLCVIGNPMAAVQAWNFCAFIEQFFEK